MASAIKVGASVSDDIAKTIGKAAIKEGATELTESGLRVTARVAADTGSDVVSRNAGDILRGITKSGASAIDDDLVKTAIRSSDDIGKTLAKAGVGEASEVGQQIVKEVAEKDLVSLSKTLVKNVDEVPVTRLTAGQRAKELARGAYRTVLKHPKLVAFGITSSVLAGVGLGMWLSKNGTKFIIKRTEPHEKRKDILWVVFDRQKGGKMFDFALGAEVNIRSIDSQPALLGRHKIVMLKGRHRFGIKIGEPLIKHATEGSFIYKTDFEKEFYNATKDAITESVGVAAEVTEGVVENVVKPLGDELFSAFGIDIDSSTLMYVLLVIVAAVVAYIMMKYYLIGKMMGTAYQQPQQVPEYR